jgi:hypothetical protein
MERLRVEHSLSLEMTREEAVMVLTQNRPDEGEYLFRQSSRSPGGVVLTMFHAGNVNHFQIERRAYDGFFVTASGIEFSNLEVRGLLISRHFA